MFRFNFDLGGSTVAPDADIPVAPARDVIDTTTIDHGGLQLYVSEPLPIAAIAAPVPIAGSCFLRAFADPDKVAPGGLDIVRGNYEGGAKVWECTLDVERWIASEGAPLVAAAKIAVDLGCGAGILGCAVQRASPRCRVIFQDLNTEVLKQVTLPTVQLNGGHGALGKTVLIAANWANLRHSIASGVADVAWLRGAADLVVSSETLYALDSYPALLNLLDALLSRSGQAIFGSKTFYFGVGGSVAAFVRAAEDYGWDASVIKTFDDATTVARSLVLVRRR